jgi:kynureninase
VPLPHTEPDAIDRATLAARDADGPVGRLRACWDVPDDLVHLDGNSLGPPARTWQDRIAREHAAWRDDQVGGWNSAGWVDLATRVAGRLAPLVGADPDEVAITDSTTVNLFQAAVAARRLRPDRHVVLTEDGNFPTDRYVLAGVAELTGARLRSVPRGRLLEHLDEDVAVVAVSHVDYRTGHRHDAPSVTGAVHDAGALMVWDLAHSTGAVEVDWHAWGADLAVGCTYKFLNGGPGAPGYVVVGRHLADEAIPAIRGWFGHAAPFDFAPEWSPAAGATRFRNGTPPVMSLAGVDEALACLEGVDVAALEARAGDLTDAFIALCDEHLSGQVEVVTPRDRHHRGAQVSLRHADAYPVMQALIDRRVLGDHRPPDLLRFGFAPALVRHVDAADAVTTLADVLTSGAYRDQRYARRQTVI